MKHLKFLAQLIENAGHGVIGETLFIGTIPSDCPSAVMLKDPLSGHKIDGGMESFYPSSVQMIVRDPDSEVSYQRALDISGVLNGINLSDNDVHLAWVIADTLPIQFPRAESDDIETSVRFRIGFGFN